MRFEIRRFDAPLGAEVIGLNSSTGLTEGERAALRAAWIEHAVLCIRDQAVGPAEFLRLARLFGRPTPQPLQRAEYRVDGHPEIRVLSSAHTDTFGDGKPLLVGGSWHTDHSHLPRPPWGTMLHAIELPSRGGNTCFTNQTVAYEALPEPMRRTVEGLVGVHVYNSRYSKRRLQTMTAAEKRRAPSARHPLVRVHDVSGRRALYFNPIRIEQFEGMSAADSQDLIEKLLEHCVQFTYEHQWRVDDVLLWDNRQALHMVKHDYAAAEPRVMHRTLVCSDNAPPEFGSAPSTDPR